jgi:hypothetical protein
MLELHVTLQPQTKIWLRSSMDRMTDSGSVDVSSNLAEVTLFDRLCKKGGFLFP